MTAAPALLSIEDRHAAWNTSGRDMHAYFCLVQAAKKDGQLDELFRLTFEVESRSSRLITTDHVARYCYLMDAGLEHTPERDEIVGVGEYVVDYYEDLLLVMRLLGSLGLSDRQHAVLELMRVHSFRQFVGPLIVARAQMLQRAAVEQAEATLKVDLAAAQRKHDDTVSRGKIAADQITRFYSSY